MTQNSNADLNGPEESHTHKDHSDHDHHNSGGGEAGKLPLTNDRLSYPVLGA
ncbi:MAG: hypothetical protein WKF66_10450 [Pedobacter sp.]